MNVFYFVKRFPRRYKTANEQKIFSLAETFLNQGYKINLVSADLSHPKEYEHLKQYPLNLINVAPKRISASLSAAHVKPDIAIFNNYEMQEMYSAYLYNKWNKCPRILQVNTANGLQKWRKSKYSMNSNHFLLPYNQSLYDDKLVFNEYERKAILRSDFYITPNDFLYYLLKSHTKQADRISLLSHGYPTRQFAYQVKQEQYRPFQSRKHFVFIGDLSKDHSFGMLFFLVRDIWPQIRKELGQAQLHVYSSAANYTKLNMSKKQLQQRGVYLKGYVQDLEIIQRYKAMLYPARWAVGLKSKVIQSFLHHTPVVTTPTGAEGMFYEMLQAKYGHSQSQSDSGFISERQFTSQQKQDQTKLNAYYSSNSLGCNFLKKLSFGGSYFNYSYLQFAKSAIQMYNDKQKWQKSLKIAHKTILKNQNEHQLQINLRQALLKMQLAVYKTRGNKQYDQQWKRIMKTKEYEKKVYQYQ